MCRLKLSDQERGRGRVRVGSLKEKIVQQEGEIRVLVDERERDKRVGEKADGLRTALTRKVL